MNGMQHVGRSRVDRQRNKGANAEGRTMLPALPMILTCSTACLSVNLPIRAKHSKRSPPSAYSWTRMRLVSSCALGWTLTQSCVRSAWRAGWGDPSAITDLEGCQQLNDVLVMDAVMDPDLPEDLQESTAPYSSSYSSS